MVVVDYDFTMTSRHVGLDDINLGADIWSCHFWGVGALFYGFFSSLVLKKVWWLWTSWSRIRLRSCQV